jgi:hypothetical protein
MFQNRDDPAGHRTLARSRTRRADRHHRLLGREHRGLRARQPEVRSCRHHAGGLVHERFMGDITVRKDDPLNMLGPDQAIEILFPMDRDTGRIQGAGQRRGIDPVVNVWNLRGGEPHDPIVRIAAKQHVEVMEIPPGGSHDQYPDLVWLGAIIHDPPLTTGEKCYRWTIGSPRLRLTNHRDFPRFPLRPSRGVDGLCLAERMLGVCPRSVNRTMPWNPIIKSRRDWETIPNLHDYESVRKGVFVGAGARRTGWPTRWAGTQHRP